MLPKDIRCDMVRSCRPGAEVNAIVKQYPVEADRKLSHLIGKCRRSGRNHQRFVQDRVDSSPGAMEIMGGRGDGNSGLGVVVQPPSADETAGLRSASRVRGKLLPSANRARGPAVMST